MATTSVGLKISEHTDPSQIFKLLTKLGEGSFGSVFEGLDQRDGQIVAIKILQFSKKNQSKAIIDLQKEINILQQCKSEYIVGYKGTYEKDGNIWIAMEYCGAGSLYDLMTICNKTLSEEEISVVMKMCLKGLVVLHDAKKIHRDIKSANILLTHEGDCKLADFGVSAELENTMDKRQTVVGTPYWMAPEVLQDTGQYNTKADIWSLGITAIELAVGEPPHFKVHPMMAIFMIPKRDPPTLPDPSKWSPEFVDFVKVCLQKNPEERPTADKLLSDHPFILKAKERAIIADLVEQCQQKIDDYRDDQEEEADHAAQPAVATLVGGAGDGGDGVGTANWGGTSQFDNVDGVGKDKEKPLYRKLLVEEDKEKEKGGGSRAGSPPGTISLGSPKEKEKRHKHPGLARQGTLPANQHRVAMGQGDLIGLGLNEHSPVTDLEAALEVLDLQKRQVHSLMAAKTDGSPAEKK